MPTALDTPRPEPICGMNTWMPVPARILEVRTENGNTKTFACQFIDEEIRKMYSFLPGQFNMLYVPGIGEAAISISSDAAERNHLHHTIRIVGSVTRAMAKLPPGSVIGLRGPFGTNWPVKEMEGKDVVIVAGGIGLAPLRPVVYWILRHRERYKRVMLMFGCRTPEDRLFAEELEQWDRDGSIQVLVTVDAATGNWSGPVGLVTKLMQRVKVNADRTVVLVCGPKILNRVAAWNFLQLHVPADHVYVSLERNMNCGFGRCGHCQLGPKFICKDGPVFPFSEIADIFTKEEI
jgi:NAD(P)H-flavin reductase